MASPSARPSPSMTAPTMPARAYGKITIRTISQRVAPIAVAASVRSAGTALNSSRMTAETIGTVMRTARLGSSIVRPNSVITARAMVRQQAYGRRRT